MKNTIKNAFFALLFAYNFANAFPVDSLELARNNEVTKEELFQHLKFLADDKLEGRYPGTPGDLVTREYVISEFKKYGLKPGNGDSFLQFFGFQRDFKITDDNYACISSEDKIWKLFIKTDWFPRPYSENGKFNSGLVFAGYGINIEDYNDFENLDIKDKFIIIYKGTPKIKGKGFPEYLSKDRLKISVVKDLGAKGVILVNPPNGEEDVLDLSLVDDLSQKSGLPVIQVKRSIISDLFESEGLNFEDTYKEINQTSNPASKELKNSKIELLVEVTQNPIETTNILGFLEGSDPVLKNEVVVIGAHYDHLGYGHRNSLDTSKTRQIHNGADDNGSGTVGVLELAQKISSTKDLFKRSVLFMCFGAEEQGLLGSDFFVKSDLFKSYNVVSMINLDMIGRLENNVLIVNGTGTSDIWEKLLKETNSNYNFSLSLGKEGFGSSDHSSFNAKKVPVLFFFSGLHSDYHRSTDDYWKINYDGFEKISKYVYDVLKQVANLDSKPLYVEVTENNQPTKTTFKMTLGVIPDFSYNDNGFKISGVKQGGLAEKGGMKAGDIIIKFIGKDIKNIYDYTAALGDMKKGEKVEVVYIRDGVETTVSIDTE